MRRIITHYKRRALLSIHLPFLLLSMVHIATVQNGLGIEDSFWMRSLKPFWLYNTFPTCFWSPNCLTKTIFRAISSLGVPRTWFKALKLSIDLCWRGKLLPSNCTVSAFPFIGLLATTPLTYEDIIFILSFCYENPRYGDWCSKLFFPVIYWSLNANIEGNRPHKLLYWARIFFKTVFVFFFFNLCWTFYWRFLT